VRIAPSSARVLIQPHLLPGHPTFDPTLIGTGLLDKYYFKHERRARVEVVKQSPYTRLGESNRSATPTLLNQLFGSPLKSAVLACAPTRTTRSSTVLWRWTTVPCRCRGVSATGFVSKCWGKSSIFSTQAGNQSARFLTSTVETSLARDSFYRRPHFLPRTAPELRPVEYHSRYRFDTLQRRK